MEAQNGGGEGHWQERLRVFAQRDTFQYHELRAACGVAPDDKNYKAHNRWFNQQRRRGLIDQTGPERRRHKYFRVNREIRPDVDGIQMEATTTVATLSAPTQTQASDKFERLIVIEIRHSGCDERLSRSERKLQDLEDKLSRLTEQLGGIQ